MNGRSEQVTQKGLKEQIGHALYSQAEFIRVTSTDTERMQHSVHREIGEESGVRKWNIKRVFVVAVAVCVLDTVTAVAAGKVVYTSGGGSHLNDFTYGKLREMETKLGYTTDAPGTFNNGYRFDMGMLIHQSAMGQDGNVIKSTGGFSLSYKKDGNPDMFITVQGTSLYDEEGQSDQTFDHNGTTLNYTRDQYRFVPPDYQVSDKEKAEGTAGELYISYGSGEVQDKVAQSIPWKDKEKVYTTITMGNPMTARDMAQMVGELIDNNQ